MSLRDYLLTRMALRQDARQRELDIEQARAARQAAEQAAYMQYGNAALQAAVQGTGKIAGAMSEADAAQKALEAEAIQARAASRALEGANAPAVGGMPVEGGETVATPEEAYKIAPYKSPVFGLLPDKLTAPSIPTSPPAVIAPPPAEQRAGGPFPSADPAALAATEALMSGKPAPMTAEQAKATEAALVAKLQAQDKMTPGERATTEAFGTPAGTVELPAGTKFAPTPSTSDSFATKGRETVRDTAVVPLPDYTYSAAQEAAAVAPYKMPKFSFFKDGELSLTAPGTAATPSQAQLVKASEVPMGPRITKGLQKQGETQENIDAAKAVTDAVAARPTATAPAQIAVPAATPPVAATRTGADAALEAATTPLFVNPPTVAGEGKVLTPPPSEKMPEGSMGGEKTLTTVPPAATVLANPDPAQDKIWAKEALDNSVKQIADLKLRTGLDLNKPAVAKSIEQASKVTGYTPPVYTKTARELAKEVTDQVWKTRPPGNPLTALFMRDNSALNKQIAEDKAFLIISGARTKHSAEHLDNFVKLEEVRSKQAMDKYRMDLLESQVLLNSAKSDKAIRFKTDLPPSERQKLQGFDLAQRSLSNLSETTRAALDEGKGLPLGTDRAMAEAYVKLNASKQGSDSASISAGSGILGGASLSISQAKGGKALDEELLQAAFDAVDQSGWTPTQKIMHGEKFKTIQNLGKALEGGKLTDDDYKKYVQILINSSDPQTYLMSLNNLMKDSFANYSTYKTNLSGTYEPNALVGFNPVDPEAFYFNKAEIDSAFAAPIGAAAARIAETGRNYRGPSTSVNPLVSGAAGTIQVLMAKLATLNPNSADANAIKAEIARLQAEAAAAAAAAASGSSSNPDL